MKYAVLGQTRYPCFANLSGYHAIANSAAAKTRACSLFLPRWITE